MQPTPTHWLYSNIHMGFFGGLVLKQGFKWKKEVHGWRLYEVSFKIVLLQPPCSGFECNLTDIYVVRLLSNETGAVI